MTLFMCLFAWTAKADVTKTVGVGGDYTSLGGAFTALNGGVLTGAVTLQIISDITEPLYGPSLTANLTNWTSLNIYPTGAARSIILNITGAAGSFIYLVGASYVTIDGRLHDVAGNVLNSDRSLTLSNPGNGGSTTIRMEANALHNTVKYCTIKGSGNNAGRSVIYFGALATQADGNGYNTINNNLITWAVSGNRPSYAIFSAGTSTTYQNRYLTIANNEFADCFSTVVGNASVVYFQSSTSLCSITGNSFYETTLFAPTATTSTAANGSCCAINVSSQGVGFDVSNNYIGGSAALCAGPTPFRKTNLFDNAFCAILMSVGASPVSTVTNNTIKNFDWSNSANGLWYGINVNIASQINVTGNTIGATTGVGSINYTGAGLTAATVCGISFTQSTSVAATGNCSNNNVGSITTNGIPATLIGIWNNGSAGTTYFQNNLIGSTTTPNSINAAATGAVANNLQLLRNGGSGIITMSGNTIANITNAATATSNLQSVLIGNGTNTFNGNFIYNLFCPNSTSAAMAAITGINIYGSTAGSTTTFSNNIISLGGDAPCNISGINEGNGAATATTNMYFNTIYIGGNEASGSTAKSNCLSTSGGVNKNIKNNVLLSTRSTVGGSSQHYALSGSAPSGTFVCDYNDYFVSGEGSKLGYYASADQTTSVIVTGQDVNSLAIDPTFANAGGTLATDYKTNSSVSLPGTPIAGITTDFSTITRGGTPRMGALESSFTTQLNAVEPTSSPRIISNAVGIAVMLTGESTIELYSINGLLIEKTKANGMYTRSLSNGMYVISIDGKVSKFIK